MAQINIISIMKTVVEGAAVNKRVQQEVVREARAVFRDKKADLFKSFDNHEVTKALLDYNSNPDQYDFLPRGNLFSFIGFEKGDRPTDRIREVLDEGVRIITFPRRKIKQRTSVVMEFTVTTPTLKDIFNATPFPDEWKSGSWVDEIENRGISGFEYYVFSMAFENKPQSRSKRGLQKKKKIGGGDIGPIPYIRALLKEFGQSFKE